MPTPFTPENIHQGEDGRWYHDGVDVTDRLIWWRCKDEDHEPWEATLAQRTDPNDAGCPACWAAKNIEGEAR